MWTRSSLVFRRWYRRRVSVPISWYSWLLSTCTLCFTVGAVSARRWVWQRSLPMTTVRIRTETSLTMTFDWLPTPLSTPPMTDLCLVLQVWFHAPPLTWKTVKSQEFKSSCGKVGGKKKKSGKMCSCVWSITTSIVLVAIHAVLLIWGNQIGIVNYSIGVHWRT